MECIGCACAYAGGTDRNTIETIYTLAKSYRLQLARGAVIAAKDDSKRAILQPIQKLHVKSSAVPLVLTRLRLEILP